MSNKPELKVEIKIIDGEWVWKGKLTASNLVKLCDFADELSDEEQTHE